MFIYDVTFINTNGEYDSTQLDIEENTTEEEVVEMINLILSLKDKMEIKKIVHIDYMGYEDEED